MIRFELLKKSHIDKIFEIENSCFPNDSWTKKMFESELDNSISVFIVGIDEENSVVICYGCIWLIADIGDITNIAVKTEYQRSGIGERIMSILIDLCKEQNMTMVNLEVKESNIPALSLYKKFGFEVVGKRKGYYKDNSTAILMTKQLND